MSNFIRKLFENDEDLDITEEITEEDEVYKDPFFSITEEALKSSIASENLSEQIQKLADKYKPTDNSQKKPFHIAVMGETRSGKKSAVAPLLKSPELLLKLRDRSGRKPEVIVETHLVKGTEGIKVYITWNESALKNTSAPPELRNKKYNELLNGNIGDVLKELGFKKLNKSEDFNALYVHVDEVIKSINGQQMNPEFIGKLISTEGIGRYVKRVVFQAAPSYEFAKVLREKNIDLYIRDTGTLVDIALDDKKITGNIPSPADYGLDGLDAVVFMATDNMPCCVSKAYKNFLAIVLRAVPVFMIARDKSMTAELKYRYSPVTKESVKNYLAQLQENTLPNYKDSADAFYGDAYAFMEKMGVVCRKDDNEWAFCDAFLVRKRVEYLVPYVKELGNSGYTAEQAVSSENFKIYQMVCTQIFSEIIEKTEDLYTRMSKIAHTPVVKEFLAAYDIMQKNGNLNFDMTPALTYYKTEDLANDLLNPECSVLGERGGITMLNNGKLRYPAAAVMAATACKDIFKVINNTPFSQGIKDALPDISEDLLSKLLSKSMVSKTLMNTLYRFIDTDACIQRYPIINRYIVCESILPERGCYYLSREKVIDSVIDNIVKAFAVFLLLDKGAETEHQLTEAEE